MSNGLVVALQVFVAAFVTAIALPPVLKYAPGVRGSLTLLVAAALLVGTFVALRAAWPRRRS